MKLKTLLLTLLLVFTSSIPNAQALTKQEIAKTSLDSTVVVVVTDRQGNALQFGSGFVIKGGMVVSNHHVISGGVGGYILANDKNYKILGVLASDEQNDLAILKISEHPIPQLSIHSGGNLKVGADVYVAGNPLGLSGTFSEGMLSSIRKVKGKQLYQITAPISQGSSGGPVLDRNAVVIGVITSYIEDGQNINFAAPSVYLNTLINNIGPLSPLSSISSTYTETTSTEITQSEISKIKPKTNKEGKLTDICCVFGVELGKKLDPELLDTERLIVEDLKELSAEQLEALLLKEERSPLNRSMIKLVLKYKENLKFMQELYSDEKWKGWTPADSLEELKKKEKKGFNILINAIEMPLRSETYKSNFSYDFIPENPYKGFDIYKVYLIDEDSLIYKIIAMGEYDRQTCIQEKDTLVDIIKNKYAFTIARHGNENTRLYNGKKKVITISCIGQAAVVIYEDYGLRSLKDRIYKKKLRSNRDSSGL